jgi:hypothetical protein
MQNALKFNLLLSVPWGQFSGASLAAIEIDVVTFLSCMVKI